MGQRKVCIIWWLNLLLVDMAMLSYYTGDVHSELCGVGDEQLLCWLGIPFLYGLMIVVFDILLFDADHLFCLRTAISALDTSIFEHMRSCC